MERLFDFQTHDLEKQYVANHLHAAARTSRTASPEHQQKQNCSTKTAPLIKVVCTVAGGSNDGHDLKQSKPHSVLGRVERTVYQAKQHNEQRNDSDQSHVCSPFNIGKHFQRSQTTGCIK